ncbi:hypothetical protein D3C74_91370 [compost metagenome]
MAARAIKGRRLPEYPEGNHDVKGSKRKKKSRQRPTFNHVDFTFSGARVPTVLVGIEQSVRSDVSLQAKRPMEPMVFRVAWSFRGWHTEGIKKGVRFWERMLKRNE